MYQTGAGYNRDQIGPRYGDDDPTTVIIVTHDINIANQTERIIEICDGKIKR